MSPEPQTAGAENSGPPSFHCLHCGKRISIDVNPGTRTECPECHKPITVPAPYELREVRRLKTGKTMRVLIYLAVLVSIPVGAYLFYSVTLWGTYRGKSMEYWLERMKHHDPDATRALAKFGSRAVPQILSLLESCERRCTHAGEPPWARRADHMCTPLQHSPGHHVDIRGGWSWV